MAWTKMNFYLSMLFSAVVIFSSLAILGTSFINNDRIDLNEKSIDYINELKGTSTDSGFKGIADTDSVESKEKGILDSEDNQTVNDNNDFLSTLYIKKERASEPTNFFKLAYNLPSSILISFGLPVNDFKHITNILSFLFFISFIIMIWRFIRT